MKSMQLKSLFDRLLVNVGIENDYIEIMGSLKSCLRVRNTFAHCNWDQTKNADFSLLILKKPLSWDLFSR